MQAKISKNYKDILNASNKTNAMWKIIKNTATSRYLVEKVVIKDLEREASNPENVAIPVNQHFFKIAAELTKGVPPHTIHINTNIKSHISNEKI